jgi:hypothetical protein
MKLWPLKDGKMRMIPTHLSKNHFLLYHIKKNIEITYTTINITKKYATLKKWHSNTSP